MGSSYITAVSLDVDISGHHTKVKILQCQVQDAFFFKLEILSPNILLKTKSLKVITNGNC